MIRSTAPPSLANLCIAAFPDIEATASRSQRKTVTLTWFNSTQRLGSASRYGELKDTQDTLVAFVKGRLSRDCIVQKAATKKHVLSSDQIQTELERHRSMHQVEKTFLREYSDRFDFMIKEISPEVLEHYQIQAIDPKNPHNPVKLEPDFIANDLIILEHGDLDLLNHTNNTHPILQSQLDNDHTILKWLAILEKNNVCHNDFKYENILYVEDQLKLIDWANAVSLKSNGHLKKHVNYLNIGTILYCPPEILFFIVTDQAMPFNKKDIWSFGIIMNTILCRSRYIDPNEIREYIRILRFKHRKTPYNLDHLRSHLCQYINDKITASLKTITTKLETIFYQSEIEKNIYGLYVNLMLNILQVDFKQRFSAQEALSFFETKIQPLLNQLSLEASALVSKK